MILRITQPFLPRDLYCFLRRTHACDKCWLALEDVPLTPSLSRVLPSMHPDVLDSTPETASAAGDPFLLLCINLDTSVVPTLTATREQSLAALKLLHI